MPSPPERTPDPSSRAVSRRGVLRLAAWGAVATALPGTSRALVAEPGERRLAFHHLHTGERLERVYWQDGDYVAPALAEIDWHLRDHRSGEVIEIDRRLLDRLFELRRRLGTRQPFQVISGYRSPATNAALRAQGHGVAKRSFHMRGMAVDMALSGRPVKELHRAALSLRAGGVGLYEASGFVHLDVGPLRRW